MTPIGVDGLAGGFAIVAACARRAQRRGGSLFRSKTFVRQGPASTEAVAQQQVEPQQEVPEISPDMAIIKDAYNVIVTNQHLKLNMLQLQRVANLGGDTEAMKRLVELMQESQVKSLKQEFLLATLIGELGALGAVWRGMREALELGELDKEVFKEQLGLESLLQSLLKFDGDLDGDFKEAGVAFGQHLRQYSNVAGAEKLVDEMEKAQVAVQETKRELEELDEQLLRLRSGELADVASEYEVAIRKLNLVQVLRGECQANEAKRSYLKMEWRVAKEWRKQRRGGWEGMWNVVTLGRHSSLKWNKEERAKEEYEDFKEDFQERFKGMSSHELGKEEADLLGEVEKAKLKYESIWEREMGLLQRHKELKASEEEQRSIYCKHRKTLQAKLQEVDAVNMSHYSEVCNAAALYAHQRDRPGTFQALRSALIKGINAYHLILSQLSALPHKKQLQKVRELSEGERWVTAAPQVGYFYKMASHLRDILRMDAPSKEAIPRLALPRMAQLHPPATEIVEAELAESAQVAHQDITDQDEDDEDEDIPL